MPFYDFRSIAGKDDDVGEAVPHSQFDLVLRSGLPAIGIIGLGKSPGGP